MTVRSLQKQESSNVPIQRRNRFERSLTSFQREMNHLFENFFGDASWPSWPQSWSKEISFPAVDIIENDKDFKVQAEIPGMNPEDIDVSVTEGFLTLKGERKEEKEEKGENYLRQETSYGSFSRTIALPETADSDRAEASFKNGILTISVPKTAAALQKPKKLQIKKAA